MKSKHWAMFFSLVFSAAPLASAQDTPPPPLAPPQPAPSADPFAAPRPPQTRAPAPPQAVAEAGGGGGIAPATAVPAPPAPRPFQPGSFTERLRNIIHRASGEGGGTEPLVVRFSSMESREQTQLEQDLAIMSHILVKNTGEMGSRAYTAMGIPVANSGAATAARSLYLEGYGTVFMLEVDFPLVRPPTEVQPNSGQSQTNSDWEEAKQEMFGGGPSGGASLAVGVDPATGLPVAARSQYSEQQVNHLRDSLLKSLKDAANIHALKPEDWVAVTVFNRAPELPMPLRPLYRARPDAHISTSGQEPGPRGTVLTLRTKFSAVKALAKGSLGFDDFSKQVDVQTYSVALPVGGAPAYGGYGGGAGF